MFPTQIRGTGLYDIQATNQSVDCKKHLALPRPIRHAQSAHINRSLQARPSLANFALSQVNAGMPPLPVLSLASVSIPGQGIGIPTPFLPYPPMPFSPFGLGPQSAELHNLNLLHNMHRVQIGSLEQHKVKTPINRNYLELAMLVCNTFRGKLFPCPHCRYVTDRRNNLKRHVSTMHQTCEKLLECCGVGFSTKASLREHIMIFHHNGYSCPYCGRRFCRKALLKRHLSVHSGQKDYTCPNCDYATSHKSNLERHKRIHERLKHAEDGSLFDCAEFSGHAVQSPDTTDTSCIEEDNRGDNRGLKEDSADDSSEDIDVTDDASEQDHFQSGPFVTGASQVENSCNRPTTESKYSKFRPYEKGHIHRILALGNHMTVAHGSVENTCMPLNLHFNTSVCDKTELF